jgi:hypothetical protein
VAKRWWETAYLPYLKESFQRYLLTT